MKVQGKKVEKKEKLVWYTLEEVFKKTRKSKAFQIAYSEEMTRLRLAEQIRELRQAKQMTQEEVAVHAKVPQSVIVRLESSQRGVALDLLIRVSHVLGKEVQLV